MDFCSKEYVREFLQDKIICLVGSGPGSLSNKSGFVDSHECVVRVNNYKLIGGTGKRTDIFYSYFGSAIKKHTLNLKHDGVKLCMAKCPNTQIIESEWHKKNNAMNGVDFRMIYDRRKDWWFCPTYVPTKAEFMKSFKLLGGHIPTTGFAALLDILSYNPAHVHITGFDFFESKLHNLNERWNPVNQDDPICHVPHEEALWLAKNKDNLPVSFDSRLAATLKNICP